MTLILLTFTNSLCPANMYGPNCDIECVNQPRVLRSFCNYLGEQECITGFQPPSCVTCAQDYYPQNICNVFCQPRDDSGGHITCDTVTGDKICLQGYEKPSRNCLDRVQGILQWHSICTISTYTGVAI